MSNACGSVEHLSLGAYVVGALDPAERAEFEAHLAGCATCRDELAELAVLPALLSRVSLEDVEDPAPAMPGGAQRLIDRYRAARRARRRRGAVAGAFALATLAAAVIVVVPRGDAPDTTSGTIAFSGSGATGAAASFTLRPAEWGTAVRVRLRGVPAGTRCRLVVRGRNGRREIAGTWRATYEGTARVTAATAIPARDVAALEVLTSSGKRLVRAPIED